jgi:hypothetical protein
MKLKDLLPLLTKLIYNKLAHYELVFMKRKTFVPFFTLPFDADVKSRKIYEKNWENTKITSSNSSP